MSDQTDEDVAVAELSTAESWRAHIQATGDPAVPARRFTEWRAGGCARTLDLHECGLSSLPVAALCEVAPRFLLLDLRGNHLRSLSGALLARCTALQMLNCNLNQLSSLPAELGACTALQRLFCHDNQLSSLPNELGACTALQELSFRNNQLSSLPTELGACTALRSLQCGNNQLSLLPAELGQCKMLQWLECSNNQLSALPVELGLLVWLTNLGCDDNPFVEGAPQTVAELRAYASSGRRTKACAAPP